MVIIVTGAIGIGKTTVCRKLIGILKSQGYCCGGIITYKAPDKGIIIEDIRAGKSEALASISNTYQGPRTGKYFFNPEGIDFGMQAIDKGTFSDILFIDEIGQLELRGEGFVKVIELIRTGKVKNCIVVIRKDLSAAFLPLLDTSPLVYETTIDNRNQLPGEIGLALTEHLQRKEAKTS